MSEVRSDGISEIDWSARFNALPPEVRRIGQACEIRTRLQQLQMERRRIKEHLAGIESHEKNLLEGLRRLIAEERESA